MPSNQSNLPFLGQEQQVQEKEEKQRTAERSTKRSDALRRVLERCSTGDLWIMWIWLFSDLTCCHHIF